MKTLLVYYSRTGTTKKIAEVIMEQLKCDLEIVQDVKSRAGALGYLRSGKEAATRSLTEIKPNSKNPSDYDLVIIGTPIWSWNMSSPIRTYLTNNKGSFKNTAFFCTMGGSGDERAFKEMAEISGKEATAALALKTVEVVKNEYLAKVEEFIRKIK